MKHYQEIYDIVTKQLGLTDQASYEKWCQQWRSLGDNPPTRFPSEEDLALLDPDTIDNRAFWEVAEAVFKTDPVSNCQFKQPYSKAETVRNNLNIYRADGFLARLDILGQGNPTATILEIGPGYGTLKHWISVNTRFTYHGVDVYPKVEDCDEATPKGLMGAVTKERLYDAVISCNVFQHLSINQRRRWYADAHAVLKPNGILMVSQFVDSWPAAGPHHDSQGRIWCRHYGQFTQIQRAPDIRADLAPLYDIEIETRRDGFSYVAHTLTKKQLTPTL